MSDNDAKSLLFSGEFLRGLLRRHVSQEVTEAVISRYVELRNQLSTEAVMYEAELSALKTSARAIAEEEWSRGQRVPKVCVNGQWFRVVTRSSYDPQGAIDALNASGHLDEAVRLGAVEHNSTVVKAKLTREMKRACEGALREHVWTVKPEDQEDEE